jgi:hypothetical protein
MISTPQLARNENLPARDAAIPDPLPDLVLVAIDERGVNVAVPVREGVRDGRADLAGLGPPGAWG